MSDQAEKRARQAEKRQRLKQAQRSVVRTHIKRVLKAIRAGHQQDALDAYRTATPVIDRMADKGIIHKNKAARHKSRLNSRIKALGETESAA